MSTAEGSQKFSVRLSKAEETFNFPLNGPPVNVLFDKGSHVLKSVDFARLPTTGSISCSTLKTPSTALSPPTPWAM